MVDGFWNQSPNFLDWPGWPSKLLGAEEVLWASRLGAALFGVISEAKASGSEPH